MSVLPYPPPPEPGWYDDDTTVMPQQAAAQTAATHVAMDVMDVTDAPDAMSAEQTADFADAADLAAEPQTASRDDDDIDWEGTVLSSAFTASAPKQEYMLYNEQTGQRVIVDTGVLLGRKPSQDLPRGVKAVKLEDPTRTISRNHAAISFDKDGVLWIEDYGSLNGTYIIRENTETKVEHTRMRLEAPCTIRIGDQFFSFEQS